jgi:hypothetical protein
MISCFCGGPLEAGEKSFEKVVDTPRNVSILRRLVGLKRDRDGSTAPKNFFRKVLTETEIALYCSACFGEMPKHERKFQVHLKLMQITCVGVPIGPLRGAKSVRPALKEISEWGSFRSSKALAFKLKSLILAQIERWRHA